MRQMKDSGIEWIGDIPASWKTNTVFQLFTQVKNKNTDLQEQNLLSLSYGRIKRKDIDTTDGLLPESFDGYNIIEADDIVLRLTDLQNDHKSLRVGLATERGIVTSAYLTIRNRSESLAKYLYYYLHSFDIAKGFYGMGAGVRQGLNWDGMKWLKVLTPPVPEQQRIVNFLDAECYRIDAVIEQTRSSIEEYKKLKQAVITQAVTKGIRPNRHMKDSGIAWIGEIPAEWDMTKVKYVATFQPSCDTSRLTEESEITYTPMECIKNGYFIDNTAPFGNVAASLTPYNDGDIVIAKVTPCFENGNIAIMENLSSGFGLGSSELFVLRPHSIETKFLFYWLQNDLFMQQGCATMTGTGGLKRVSPYFVKNCPLPFPEISEQEEIVSYLDKKTKELDALMVKKENYLAELEAYKKSFIFEYVT
ncbi:MAG: restriction endonuclease subunit S, partial [Aeriscardovia sp.]|nr:restriction endonuclease subunit S [Aeriscardovia sp.]